MAFLFDTDAISEVLKKRPNQAYLSWLRLLPREVQYTSTVTIGELYKGAFKSQHLERHLENIERRVLPAVTILPFDLASAKQYGSIAAELERAGQRLEDADLQIAAVAIANDLALVTGNLKHYSRIPGLKIEKILDNSRLTGVT